MTPEEIGNSEFPIFQRAMTNAEEARKIGCLHPNAVAAIKGMQPHLRGGDYSTHPLWQLHELNRIDKHRALIAVARMILKVDSEGVGHPAIGFRPIRNVGRFQYVQSITENFDPIKSDAVLLRYAVTPDESWKLDMQVDPVLPIQIVFAEGGGPAAHQSIVPVLKGLCDFVGDGVMAPLAKFL
jgi:hypothetical protein